MQDENSCSTVVVRDGNVGQLRFNHKTLTFDFEPYGRACWRHLDFVREQLDGDVEKWDEIDEKEAAREAIRLAMHKLPIKSKFAIKGQEEAKGGEK